MGSHGDHQEHDRKGRERTDACEGDRSVEGVRPEGFTDCAVSDEYTASQWREAIRGLLPLRPLLHRTSELCPTCHQSHDTVRETWEAGSSRAELGDTAPMVLGNSSCGALALLVLLVVLGGQGGGVWSQPEERADLVRTVFDSAGVRWDEYTDEITGRSYFHEAVTGERSAGVLPSNRDLGSATRLNPAACFVFLGALMLD